MGRVASQTCPFTFAAITFRASPSDRFCNIQSGNPFCILPYCAIRKRNIAKSISEGLARKVLAASINGQVWDATRPINEDASIKLLTWNDAEGKSTFWHSSAHLMAEAVESLFPGVKFWVGPPVENGFYYDMDLGDRKMTEEDLGSLKKR